MIYKYSNIGEEERINICNEYIKYKKYENINYYSYDYCHLYNFEILKEDRLFYDEDGEICGFIPKGETLILDELNMSFEEIFIDLERIKLLEFRDDKLDSIINKSKSNS